MTEYVTRLPPSPEGKTGWPWTAGDYEPQEPICALPRISIVTPCLNGGAFLEECIRSVLLQGYPNLEYVIIDGGSTDQTLQIISKYEQFLSYWVSEKDPGQTAAINKGVARCSGALVNWLNADDIYLPGALHAIGQAYLPGENLVILSPVRNVYLDTGEVTLTRQDLLLSDVVRYWSRPDVYHQPGVFLPLSLWNELGGLDESFEICADYELYCRIAPFASFRLIENVTVEFRRHKQQKSTALRDVLIVEKVRSSKRYWARDNVTELEKSTHDRHVAKIIGKHVDGRNLGVVDSLMLVLKLCRATEVSWTRAILFYLRLLK